MSKIAVAIASLGRPDTVAEVLAALDRQTRTPDIIIFSVTSDADLPDDLRSDGIHVIYGEKGLCAQRNRVLEYMVDDYDYLVFFDDDFVPSKFAVERIEEYFNDNPEIVGITGNVIEDGINGPGISYEKACEIVSEYDDAPRPPVEVLKEVYGLYGCNMAYRTSVIGNKRFDENLPFYGWLEDVDFAAQIGTNGRLVRTTAFAGVHCGVKSARSPGLRLGYSQVANPIYMNQKGTLRWSIAAKSIGKNFIANHVKTLKPEPWVDRWGRTKGNWLAIRHLIMGKLSPTNIRGL